MMKWRWFFAFPIGGLFANPSGMEVVRGSAAILLEEGVLHVQASDRSVLTWDSFSINAGETARFTLPSSNAAVLNRVTGILSSRIAGSLESNGHVYLINPAGILVDSTGIVNTAGFIASTLDALDTDFIAAGPIAFAGDSRASVVNLGSITASGGDIFLVGYTINNEGSLTAASGAVGFGAGSKVILSPEGLDRLHVEISLPEVETSEDVGILDTGAIQAKMVEMRADGHLYAEAIRHSGTCQALQVAEEGGRIYLVSEDGVMSTSGTLSGHEIDMLGRAVGVLGDARLIAQEGAVYVGGGFQGKDPDRFNAKTTIVGVDARIDVSGREKAGKAIFWADDAMYFGAQILGTAELEGADVEVSGKKYMEFEGLANLMAQKPGTLLLDPTNLQLGGAADQNIITLGGAAGNFATTAAAASAPTAGTRAIVTTGTIIANLAVGNLTLSTSQSDVSTEGGDIVLIDLTGFPALTAATANNLTLAAARHINIHDSINLTAGGEIHLIAGGDAIIGPAVGAPAGVTANLTTSGGTTGQGHIHVQGGSVTFIARGTAGQTISSANGNIFMVAKTADINFLASQGAAGSLSVTSTSASVQNVWIHAEQGNIVAQAGSGAGSSIAFNSTSGSVHMTAMGTTGVQLLAGSGTTSHVLITTPGSNGKTMLNAPNGGIDMYGTPTAASTGRVSISGSDSVEFISGRHIRLQGGPGTPAGGASAEAIATNRLSFNADGNVFLTGGTGTNSSILLHAGNYMSGKAGASLVMQGGSGGAGGQSVTIRTVGTAAVTGLCNLAIGTDLLMEAGNSTGSFVQIGNNTNAFTSSPIVFSEVNGNLLLRAGQGAITNSYAMIGHGTFGGGTISVVSGDIVFATGVGGNVIMEAGSASNAQCFAQIGHAGGQLGATPVTGTITGNIKLNEIGNYLTMNPNADYCAIGHGTNLGTIAVRTITGDIHINASIGSVRMNTGSTASTDVFTQIGHVSGSSDGVFSASGDIFCDVGGAFRMQTTASVNSLTLVGHGNTNTPVTASFAGQIRLNCESLELIAGNAAAAHAQIGFFGGTIIPTQPRVTNLIVVADKDIMIQGGGPTAGSGNAAIGLTAGVASAAIDIDNLTVQSNHGNITIMGGGGTAAGTTGMGLIGVLYTGIGVPLILQSRINVIAPHGEVSLRGTAPPTNPASTATHGYARIVTGDGGFSSPYGITIDCDSFSMVGSDNSSGIITGYTAVQSTGDLYIKAAKDISLVTGTGLAGNFTPVVIQSIAAQGAPFKTQMALEAGNNITMKGGTQIAGANGAVLVSPFIVAPDTQASLTLKAGNHLIVEGGTGTSQFVTIGPSLTTPRSSFTCDVNTGGDIILQGGDGSAANVSLASGTFSVAATDSSYTSNIRAGRDILIAGGGGAVGAATALVGPTSLAGTGQTMILSLEAGDSLYLQGGAQSAAQSAQILPTAITNTNSRIHLSLDIGNDLILQGGTSGTTLVSIGSTSAASSISGVGDSFNISGRIGRDLRIISGTTSTSLVGIGHHTLSGSEARLMIDLTVGGDFELTSAGAPVFLGMPVTGTLSNALNEFILNLDVAGSFFAAGSGSNAGIVTMLGCPTLVGANQNAVHRVRVGGSAVLEGGSASAAGSNNSLGMGTAATFSATNSSSLLNISVGGDLEIRARSGTSNVVNINSSLFSGNNSTLSTLFTVGGELLIDMGSGTGTTQIGPGLFSGTFQTYTQDITVGESVRVIGSSSTAVLQLGPTNLTGTNGVANWSLVAGKNINISPAQGGSVFLGSGTAASGVSGQFSAWNQTIRAGTDLNIEGPVGAVAILGIGPQGMSGADTRHTLVLEAGGNLSIIAGNTGGTLQTLIGPPSMNGLRAVAEITFKSGKDLLIQNVAGANNQLLVGAPVMNSIDQEATVIFDVGGHMTVYNGSASGPVANAPSLLVGPQQVAGTRQVARMQVKTGGDFYVQGSSSGIATPFTFGPPVLTLGSAFLNFDIGGSAHIEGGSGASCPVIIGFGSGTLLNGLNTIASMQFKVAGDCVIQGGAGTSSTALLGFSGSNGGANSNESIAIGVDVGGTLSIRGGANTSTHAGIGVTSTINAGASIIDFNVQTGQNLVVQAGTGGASHAFIGNPFGVITTNSAGTTINYVLDIGGTASFIGGALNATSMTVFGPQTMSGTNEHIHASLRMGGDLEIFGGQAVTQGNVLFCAPLMTAANQEVVATLDIGGAFRMNGGATGAGALVQFGPQSMTQPGQVFDLSLKTGGDFELIGASSGGVGCTTVLGIASMTGTSNQLATMNFDIGGNATIRGGTGTSARALLGQINSGTISSPNSGLAINFKTGGNLHVEAGTGGTGTAYIGAVSLTGIGSHSSVNFDVGGTATFRAGSITTSGQVFVGPSTMSAQYNLSRVAIKAGGHCIIDGAGTSGGGVISSSVHIGGGANLSLASNQQALDIQFDIGGDLLMTGSLSDTSNVIIGCNSVAFSATATTVSIAGNIGGDMKVFGGGGNASTVTIGPITASGSNSCTTNISFNVGGSLHVEGGQGTSSLTFLGIGAGGQSGTNTDFTMNLDVANNVTIRGGVGTTSPVVVGAQTYNASQGAHVTRIKAGGNMILHGGSVAINSPAIIGPITNTAAFSSVSIALDAGGDFLMRGGASGGGTLVGAMTMSNTVSLLDVHVTAGGTITIDPNVAGGGLAANSLGQIGPQDMSGAQQTALIHVAAGKDMIIEGAFTGAFTRIGATSMTAAGTPGFQSLGVTLDVGGTLFLRGSGGQYTVIGASTVSSNGARCNVAVNAGTIDLMTGIGPALIGLATMSGANSSLAVAVNAEKQMMFGGGQFNYFVGAQTQSGTNSDVAVRLSTPGDCMIQTVHVGSNNVIGTQSFTGGQSSSSVNFDVGGDLSLMGTTDSGIANNNTYIGPQTMTGNDQVASVGMQVGGDVLLQAGTGTNNAVRVAAPTMSGTNQVLMVDLDIGESLTLSGGNATGAAVRIGPLSMGSGGNPDNNQFLLNARIGGDLNLFGGAASTTNVRIGVGDATSFIALFGVNLLMNFDVGGNVTLLGGAGATTPVMIGHTEGFAFAGNIQTNFQRIGGNLSIQGGSGLNSFALIGSRPIFNALCQGDLFFGPIGGNVYVGAPAPSISVSYGIGAYSQIGNVGDSTIASSTIRGDITFERIAGHLSLRSGNNTNTFAIIGHDNFLGHATDIISGKVSARAGSASLSVVSGSAVFGFDPPTGANNINSSLVELICDREITLTAGNTSGKAVIGYLNTTSTGTQTISNVNVTARDGNLTLVSNFDIGQGLGHAGVGIVSGGTTLGNVKVTSNRDVRLSSTSSAPAYIANRRLGGGAAPGFTVSIDPMSIILLSGGVISSTGNLALDFDDRLDLNFDSTGGVLQSLTASILANNDIFINTTTPSLGLITINGSTFSFPSASTSLASTLGDIYIGSNGNAGAGSMNIGSGTAGASSPVAVSGRNLIFNLGNALAITADTGATSTSSLSASQNVNIGAAGNIAVTGNVTNAASLTAASGYIDLNAGGNVTAGQNGSIATTGVGTAQGIHIVSGFDMTLSSNGTISAAASDGDITLDAGRTFTAQNTSVVATTQDINITAGTDITVSGAASVASSGSGDLVFTAGRDINHSSGNPLSTGGGDVLFTADRNINHSGTVTTSGNAQMALKAGRDVTTSGVVSQTGTGSILIDAAQDFINSGTVTQATTGAIKTTAGRDTIHTGTITTGSGSIHLGTGRNYEQTGGTAATTGTNPFYITARNDFTLTGATISHGGGDLHVIAGRHGTITSLPIAPFTPSAVSAVYTNVVVDHNQPSGNGIGNGIPTIGTTGYFGRGFLTKDAASTITGSEVRLYTSRQNWNSIAGNINGVPFVPGTPYTDTAQEVWLSYYERTLAGDPFTVFYKDHSTTLPPPPPPTPPSPPSPPSPPASAVNIPLIFWVAIAEAFQDWKEYDTFNFADVDFLMDYLCSGYAAAAGAPVAVRGHTAGGGGASCSTIGNKSMKLLRQGYKNYHTKKLDTKL